MDNPVVEDEKMYFSTLHKEVNVMDMTTNQISKLMTAESEIWGHPLIMGDRLIVADMNGVVYCVDKEDGTVLWKTQRLTSDKNGFIAAPVALNDETIILVSEDGDILAYDLSGKSLGKRSLKQPVLTTPVVLSDHSLVIAPNNGEGLLIVFSETLHEDWTYTRSDDTAK